MPLRLSSRTRAVLGVRRAALRTRPQRPPIIRIFFALTLAFILGVGSLTSIAFIAAAGAVTALAGDLPDPAKLASLTFNQPTIIYDRTGKIELARFEREKRRVVAFDEVPKLVLDATTTAEDRSFWTNDGYDPAAILAAAVQNVSGEGSTERGASTITQQLTRARLLPDDVVNGGDRYLRKLLEVVQASRLTEAFPGEAGKQKIITAYLNEIYYGHEAYGIAAAANIYFGVTDLAELTPAQAALLAGLPKAPSVYDPYRYAVKDSEGRLVVPKDSPPMVRRDYILRELATSRWTQLTPQQVEAALDEDVILVGDQPTIMRAPHFSWAVRAELVRRLGSLEAVETGGYRVITTLDWDAQQLAERYLYGAAIIPNLARAKADKLLAEMDFSRADKTWIRALRGKDIHNGALVALDYRRGDVLAYAGSAGYYRQDIASRKFQPQYDVAAASRQPGSAFKAIVYTAAFEQQVLTPASVLLDISTDFGGGWAPKDADEAERGPLLVRTAIQQSLNLPAVRALERVGNEPVATVAEKLGVNFLGGHEAFLQAGLAGAIGTVETRPIDLTGAFGAIGNGGVKVPTRLILSIAGPNGASVYRAPDEPEGVQAVSPQAAFLMSDILAGNTDPGQNSWWSRTLAIRNGPDGQRRPAAAKTGTADNRKDFSTYGYLAPPKDPAAPAIAVGVWMGNSDHSPPQARVQATSLTTAGQVWHAFLRDYTKGTPIADFRPPKGVVQATADKFSGGQPGPWTRATVKEWFIKGTEPGARHEIDPAGLLYSRGCAGWMVDPVKAELGPPSWDDDVAAWVIRARQGIGTRGPLGSTIAQWGGSWGGPLMGPCARPPDKGDGPGGGRGGGGGGGGHGPKPTKPPPPPDGQPAELGSELP